MLKIGDFSKLTQTTVKTLRYYEKEGLLIPVKIDQFTGYRYYDTAQLSFFNRIIALRQLGLSIDDIQNILAGASLDEYLERRKIELQIDIETSQRQLSRLNLLLEDKESQDMKYEVIIKKIPEYTVFYKEGVLDKYQDVGKFVLLAGEQVATSNPGLKCVEPDYCFMEYLDKEYRETDIKARYSQAVIEAGVDTKDIKFKRTPEVTVASIYHKGSYDNFRETYTYIMKWIEQNGYSITDCARECYIDGIWNKENVEDWLTEIQVPIHSKEK